MQLLTATTLLGGMSVWSKRVCSRGLQGLAKLGKAKDFEDILRAGDVKLDSNFIKEAMLQGGGLGILGDFLLGEYDRYGNTFTQSIMGPGALDINNIAAIATHIKNGEYDKAMQAGKKWSNARIAFGNLFYAQLLGLDARSLINRKPNIFLK